ncbi:antibiotic biosynthesis monooxygenase [Planotetraspora sp. A-T 1434]|uniref:antibiotic biosynthesis monooxygenase family protein n=1 Tax=Planotetraspora sp. A-T 1434 TaxID=2979219 RepID=UPI0021C1A719|nr:antibiotic biosynthesis monooxygenase family protein [Planotetraspora sp. A-T 1434]MCT9932180.1 antibiotic biosynthesis monooxygenase [Planotetraspora sp. A-T 1434]
MAVWEVAQLVVAKGKQDEFESVVRSNLSLLTKADGCLDVKLFRAIDKEGVFLMCALWETLEHHTEVFVKTEAFIKLSSAVGPFFVAPPEVFHVSTVI